jgi:hypothetical protein
VLAVGLLNFDADQVPSLEPSVSHIHAIHDEPKKNRAVHAIPMEDGKGKEHRRRDDMHAVEQLHPTKSDCAWPIPPEARTLHAQHLQSEQRVLPVISNVGHQDYGYRAARARTSAPAR